VLKYVSASQKIASATIMRRDEDEGKRFFFEKKKQKTFIPSPSPSTRHVGATRNRTDKSFLVLFFKKEHLSHL
jgi:hypothetical protein